MNEKPGQELHPERDRELLSALMDGETSELELRRALKATEQDPALAATWRRYHLAQAILRGELDRNASVDRNGIDMHGIDLRGGISARIDALEQDEARSADDAATGKAPTRMPAWLRPLGRVAVAAAVAVITVFAWQTFDGTGFSGARGDAVAQVDAAADQHVTVGPMVVVREDGEEVVAPAAASAEATLASASTDSSVASPTAEQDRLNAYLTRHAQAASSTGAHGLAPYARVVSFEGEQAP